MTGRAEPYPSATETTKGGDDVKIRLMGLPDEVDEAAPYPCRGNSRQVRVYAKVRTPAGS